MCTPCHHFWSFLMCSIWLYHSLICSSICTICLIISINSDLFVTSTLAKYAGFMHGHIDLSWWSPLALFLCRLESVLLIFLNLLDCQICPLSSMFKVCNHISLQGHLLILDIAWPQHDWRALQWCCGSRFLLVVLIWLRSLSLCLQSPLPLSQKNSSWDLMWVPLPSCSSQLVSWFCLQLIIANK